MIYRELGRTGLRVSVIGFGGMRFFQKDEQTAIATVQRCLEKGINFIETGSYGNGRSEELLGKALWSACRREAVVLSDKCGASSKTTPEQVRQSLEASLKRYRTDYFDIFNFWGTNTLEQHTHIIENGLVDALLKAKQDGLIRHIGLTTHARPEWIGQFVDAYPWDMIVLKEHMLYSRNQALIDTLFEKGVGSVAMTPLAGGVVCSPSADLRAEIERAGSTPARLGLRYLVANPHLSSVVSGMASPEEVEENALAGATDGALTETEQHLVALIRERTRGLGERFCTSCGYCMPCPQEVNIPGIFRLWNLMRGYGSATYSALEYGKMGQNSPWADFSGQPASACVACGACESKCPENLPIIADLKRAHADLSVPAPK